MGQLSKILLYALFAFLGIMWCLQIFKSCNKSKDLTNQGITAKTEQLTTSKEEENTKDEEGDLIVYNEEEEEEGDDFLDDYEDTDDSIEEEEEKEDKRSLASTSEDKYASSGRNIKEVAAVNEFTSKGDASGKNFLVLAGSFENPANARTFVAKLSKLGYDDAEIVKFDHSSFSSVCVGRYYDRASANEMAKALKKDKFPAYVHSKRIQKK